MKYYLAGLLVAVFALPISNVSAQEAYMNDNARVMFERYGSTDGSDTFAQAYANGTISGYHTSRTIGSNTTKSATTRISPTGAGLSTAGSNFIGVSSSEQTARNFNGVTTYGESFRTFEDGTRMFETEGAPVAVARDGTVYASVGAQPQYDQVLASASTTPATSSSSEIAIARRYFDAYGSTGSSSFDNAYNDQTIIGYSTDDDGLDLNALKAERDRARNFFNTYGSTDGSDDFETAYQNQSIPGYSAQLPGTSLTSRERVTNKYTTGRFSQYTDTTYRTASNNSRIVSPYSFANRTNVGSESTTYSTSTRSTGTGFSLAKTPDQIRQIRASRAAARAAGGR